MLRNWISLPCKKPVRNVFITGNSQNQMIVSISRFGYLKSGYPMLPDPQKQCEAFRKVLDHNNIKKVFILAGSAGGTIAFKFGLLYPDRVAGLILISSAIYDQN